MSNVFTYDADNWMTEFYYHGQVFLTLKLPSFKAASDVSKKLEYLYDRGVRDGQSWAYVADDVQMPKLYKE